MDKYNKRAKDVSSLVCVGLDPDYDKLPERFKAMENPQFEFSKWIIDETHEHAAAYKPNSAFFEARGAEGIQELKMTFDYLHEKFPDIFTILDAKRGDIGNTNNGYVNFAYDYLGADSITLHPYLGKEALTPFLGRKDKTSIILCRTSNEGSQEFQNLKLVDLPGRQVWEMVADNVAKDWNGNNNCMLVVGATYPDELGEVRRTVGDMTLLVPGVGAQGGSIKDVVNKGLNSEKLGLIISSSRGIIFSKDPKEEAKKLKEEINKYCDII